MANVLILGGGGPAGVNFCRAAMMGGHRVIAAEENPLHRSWLSGDEADVVIPSPPLADGFEEWLEETCKAFGIDVIHSQPEQPVQWLADREEHLPAATLLPDRRTIAVLQDKFETSWRWSRDNLRPSPVVKFDDMGDVTRAEQILGYPIWIRATRGAGARGATVAHCRSTATAWLQYWWSRDMPWEFIAEQYLPGRDFAWTSLWRDGEVWASQARERIEYIYPHLAPSGRTGTPTAAVTVHDERVDDIARQAVLAIDPDATGVFCVDLREDDEGGVWPTEINAGRFFTTSEFYAQAGYNFVDVYIHASLDEWKNGPSINPIPEGIWWLRHIDIPAVLVDERDNSDLYALRHERKEITT